MARTMAPRNCYNNPKELVPLLTLRTEESILHTTFFKAVGEFYSARSQTGNTAKDGAIWWYKGCLLYTSPSPRDS